MSSLGALADRSISPRWPRVVVGALVGAAVAGAPYLLLYLTAWDDSRHFSGDWPFPLAFVVAPFFGSFVFTLVAVAAMDRTGWLSSCVFALVISVAMAGAWGSQARDEGRRYDNFSFGWAISAGVAFLLLSLVGAVSALLLARFLGRKGQEVRRSVIRPWHVGAAIAVVELAAMGVVIAKSG